MATPALLRATRAVPVALAGPASEAFKMALLNNIMVALEDSVDLDLGVLKEVLPHNITVAMEHSVDLDLEVLKEDLVVPDLEGPKTVQEDTRVFLMALADLGVIMADLEVIMGAPVGQADLRVAYVIAAL